MNAEYTCCDVFLQQPKPGRSDLPGFAPPADGADFLSNQNTNCTANIRTLGIKWELEVF